MKKVFLISTIALFLLSGVNTQAQNLRDLKDKGSKVVKDREKSKGKSKQKKQTEKTPEKAVVSKASTTNAAEIRAFVDARAEISRSWPFDVHANSISEYHIAAIEKLNMSDFEEKLNEYKKKKPTLFQHYGHGQVPSNMTKGQGSRPWDSNSDEHWANDYITKYYIWKDKIAEQTQGFVEVISKHMSDAEGAMDKFKLEKASDAVRVALAIQSINPGNSQIESMVAKSKQVQDKCFEQVQHLLTGDMHKTNIKKLVAFNAPQTIGKENSSQIIKEITPGKPFYLIGYFTDQLVNLDCKGHISGIPYTKAPLLEWKQVGAEHIYGRMQLYWNEGMVSKLQEQSYFMFEMFPDPNKVDFKSHIEYIPIMNFVKWLTLQKPGVYEFYFKFSNGAATNVMAENNYKIQLTKENIAELNKYYDQLEEKRIKAVTFNQGGGCTDVKSSIGNSGELKKYGEPVKITVKETGPVYKPWPNEHMVDYFVGYGYGAFKRPDGKNEIILLNFRRTPTENNFSFFGANLMNHYEIEGSSPIKFPVLNLGYEISAEGINKCTMW